MRAGVGHQSARQVALEHQASLKANLAKLEEESNEELLKRYQEQTRLNKVEPGVRKSLIERQADVGKIQGGQSFKQAEQRIKVTEQTTTSLKSRRAKCQEAIDADVAAMHRLDVSIAEYTRKLQAVNANYEAHCNERVKLKNLLAESKQKSASLMQDCGTWRAKVRRDDHLRSRAFAAEMLRTEKGFSCAQGTTCTLEEARQRSLILRQSKSTIAIRSPAPGVAKSTSALISSMRAASDSKPLATSQSSYL